MNTMKKLTLFCLLIASPAFAEQDGTSYIVKRNTPTVQTFLLSIENAEGALVKIRPDGSIVYGQKYTPDEAAKIFWEAMGKEAAKVCK